MDYEKKKTEALEELKQCDRYDIEPAKTILKIFPELEESDYIIKQRLRHLLGYFRSRGIDHDLCNRILNWLEKQSDYNRLVEEIKERKELISKEKEKATSTNDKLSLGGRIAILEELLAFTKEKQGEPQPYKGNADTMRKNLIKAFKSVGSNHWGGFDVRDIIHFLESKDAIELEKQSEQKQNPCEDCNHAMLNCNNFPCEEKKRYNGEQKSTDKAEPKFKVGNWVVFNNDHDSIYQIEKIENYEYTLRHILGGSMSLSFSHRDMIRAWTIQDAKDGDVLYCISDAGIEYIVMNKGININNNVDSYFRYNSIDGFAIDIPSVLSADNDSIIPATKEQRDRLFQKMEEKGYEWNADKKKLKKIEQELYPETLDKAIELYYYSYGNDKGGFDNLSLEKFKDIVKTFVDDYGMQNPAWSDDDELMLTSTVNTLKLTNGAAQMKIDWLKSLKNRVQPQQKQEWSEEDEKMRNKILQHLGEFHAEYPELYIKDEFDWLKSLKSQPRWKPTEEQMEDLEYAINMVDKCCEDSLQSLYNDLKKL